MPVWNPKKNEAELQRWRGDLEIKGDYEIGFAICLTDSRLAHPVDIVTTLDLFTKKARTVCSSLKAKCLEITSRP
jgi:hypothetical protein